MIIRPILIGLALLITAGCSRDSQQRPTPDWFYTSDDGATYLKDQPGKFVPFNKDGRVVVRAHVGVCAGKLTVLYLSRFSEAARRAIDTGAAVPLAPPDPNNPDAVDPAMAGQEFKLPGDPAWVSAPRTAVDKIRERKCPDGTTPQAPAD